jgi:hypothetical protein
MPPDPLPHDPNPYAPPQPTDGAAAPPLSAIEVKARLRTPAYGLLASAVWGIGVALFLGATVTLEKLHRWPHLTVRDQCDLAGYGCTLLAFVLVAVTIARGAWAMLHITEYFAARNAAMLALLPCGGAWIIGLPFGIWALWVLRDPRVQEEFRRRRPWRNLWRRATTTPPPPA